jgi:hypothetical protein
MLVLPASTPLPETEPLPDLKANAKERLRFDLLAAQGDIMQQWLYERCKRDFFFWAEHTCFWHDAFAPIERREGPLVFYKFQREMAETMIFHTFKAVNERDYRWNCGADKARRMTCTYTSLLLIQWFAQFHSISSVVTSKTDEDVDIADDMNTPLQRLKWQIRKQPDFLLPPTYSKTNKSQNKIGLVNFGQDGQIAGIAPNGEAMRQARALIWLGDEFGFVPNDVTLWEASSGTVKVRYIFSTPNGPFCKFYRLVYKKDKTQDGNPEQFHLFELDWWKHPENAIGLFRKSDGSLSSPMFEGVIANNTRQVVAREWLRNHAESVGGLIYFMFNRNSKVLNLPVDPTQPLLVSWDPGLNFAVSFGQRDRNSRLLLFYEVVMRPEDVSRGTTLLRAVAERVIWLVENVFKDYREKVKHIGDPYASHVQIASQEKTEFQMLYDLFQIKVASEFMYKIGGNERKKKRIEIMSDLMVRSVDMDDGTESPALLIDSDHCPITVEAYEQGYRRQCEVDGQETDIILDSHPFSDVADSSGMIAVYSFGRDLRYMGAATDKTQNKRDREQRQKWRRTGRR